MSWSPSPPNDPRDDTRDDTVYNVPMGRVSQPPRFPGFLLAAVIAALIAFAALGAIFFSGNNDPGPSRSPKPSSSTAAGSGSPGSTDAPARSNEPDESGPLSPAPSGDAPSDPGAIVAEVCAEPVPTASGVRTPLVEVFREYCREAVTAVLAEAGPEPGSISELGWGYAADTPLGAGADLPSYVYLAVDEGRIRRYLVESSTTGGPAVVTRAGRVAALPADVFFALSATRD